MHPPSSALLPLSASSAPPAFAFPAAASPEQLIEGTVLHFPPVRPQSQRKNCNVKYLFPLTEK